MWLRKVIPASVKLHLHTADSSGNASQIPHGNKNPAGTLKWAPLNVTCPGLHRCHTQVRDIKVHVGAGREGLHRCEKLRFTQVQDVKVYTGVRCKGLHRCEMLK